MSVFNALEAFLAFKSMHISNEPQSLAQCIKAPGIHALFSHMERQLPECDALKPARGGNAKEKAGALKKLFGQVRVMCLSFLAAVALFSSQ